MTVCFKNGCVKGTKMDGYQIESFEAFMGIPFAKPPIGELRFEVSYNLKCDLKLELEKAWSLT
jgi:carboxylesterase type B